MTSSVLPTASILKRLVQMAWQLEGIAFTHISSGHINLTFAVETSQARYILQRLSPIFGPEVNLDIDAITIELEAQGMITPRIIPTSAGMLWFTDETNVTWRLLTFISGTVVETCDTPLRCYQAGHLLGNFHRALWRCKHCFVHQRLCVHDTKNHLINLQSSLQQKTSHRAYSRVAPLAQQILATAGWMASLENLPKRVVHGDPKITNIIFDHQGKALSFIDLDTMARMPLAVELGDALRSWCSPLGEEAQCPIDLDFFRMAIKGYAEAIGDLPALLERAAFAPAVEVIAIELAARFCRDALEESYFGWDPARFDSATDHNLTRAQSQLTLALSIREHLPEMQAIVDTAWS